MYSNVCFGFMIGLLFLCYHWNRNREAKLILGKACLGKQREQIKLSQEVLNVKRLLLSFRQDKQNINSCIKQLQNYYWVFGQLNSSKCKMCLVLVLQFENIKFIGSMLKIK